MTPSPGRRRTGEAEESANRTAARIGRTIRGLRVERGLTLQEVAEGALVSASFVGALERGETDIAIGRLERIADFFGESIESVLGYAREEVRFNYVPREDWTRLGGEAGVDGAECAVPGTSLLLTRLTLAPGTEYEGRFPADSTVTVYLESGSLQLAVADRLFHLEAGDAGAFKAINQHLLRNVSDIAASMLLTVSPRG
ncbi:XRE family transcriptional regulator [Streptomyces sp. NPDC093252]|uniref:XRE family transcriptional regulator n=1 Tax=Streptomyces sp. NPDC093252 TaxID=3154980 RepID=UPI00344176CC